jgi:hypothetical protein
MGRQENEAYALFREDMKSAIKDYIGKAYSIDMTDDTIKQVIINSVWEASNKKIDLIRENLISITH